MVIRYIVKMKRSNFYLKDPPYYRNKGVEKWSTDINMAYRFSDCEEAEEVLKTMRNNVNIKIKPIREEKKEEKLVMPSKNKDESHKDYGINMKYEDYNVSMTFTNETEISAIDKVIGENLSKSRTIGKPLVMATLKPK